MNTSTNNVSISYLGPPGGGLGFQLAGMTTIECVDSDTLLQQLKRLVTAETAGIVFVDEGLAEPIMDEIDVLNEGMLPAIVLLTNPVESKRIAASKMNRLMVRAVGSDIFGE